jgi:hypothetical protein
MSLSSILGPPALKCHWCGASVATDRLEWREMGWFAKTWFFGVSLLYAVLAYFMGGLCTTTAVQLFETGEMRNDWGLSEATF